MVRNEWRLGGGGWHTDFHSQCSVGRFFRGDLRVTRRLRVRLGWDRGGNHGCPDVINAASEGRTKNPFADFWVAFPPLGKMRGGGVALVVRKALGLGLGTPLLIGGEGLFSR